MDEGLLNDLLECSVCLERLDTSSRVLPCQHTFCLKCLKVLIALSFYATGKYQRVIGDIAGHSVAQETVSHILRQITKILNLPYFRQKYIKFPRDPGQRRSNIAAFYTKFGMPGVLGCIDCTQIAIVRPKANEDRYYCRKQYHSLNVQLVIVESHKELRCPECRILVETKVEELPPNVLLMRILEGMKNSAPRKILMGQRTSRSGHSQGQQGLQLTGRDGKQLPPHARALYDFISKEPEDLSFKKGETILLQKKLDPFWYQGECSGRTGMFPSTYVQVVIPLPVATALCKAMYDFRMSAPEEEGCLAFDKGAIITVHRRVDDNWAEGRLDQRVGIFPIAFVELNQAARQLMNSAPLNRPVPPAPEHARPSHSDHRHHAQHPHRYQQMSMSTPTTGQSNYQNMATMSQSHPNYPQILVPGNQHAISHVGLVTTTALPRNIMEPTHTKHSLDLIQFTNMHNKSHQGTIQSVSRINENYDRLRAVKYTTDSYNSTPVHKVEIHQNVRTHEHLPVSVANLSNNLSSDSSSSNNTASVVSSSTPNTSSDTSACDEPSLPSSPDNNERNVVVVTNSAPAVVVATNTLDEETNDEALNTSMGVLSVNESSTATNTSLNVSLPPPESPKPGAGGGAGGAGELLTFGLGLQAALSPAHARTRDPRDKRHSLTPSTHLQHNHTQQNRHSAEIVATSLLDAGGGLAGGVGGGGRERRRRRSRSNERPLPAAYVAIYPYKPQKPDELELKKGGIYTVTERCRDGWYKGCSERSQQCGVFPGNYVAPSANVRPKHDKSQSVSAPAAAGVSAAPAPDAPPRARSAPAPAPAPAPAAAAQPLTYPWSSQGQHQPTTPRIDKSKEKTKSDKSSISAGGMSLMKRLAAMKKCKSPPPAGYSMDNPVFEDGPGTSLMLNLPQQHHPVHVRSGSCPSQLLRALPPARHKERPLAPSAAPSPGPAPAAVTHEHLHIMHRATTENPWQSQHRKSQSLDVTASRRDRHHSQPVKERFRCIVPYPPNSEYELELKVDDIVIVTKKRGDGWYKGTLQRTGRTGLFPASFVQAHD